MSSPRSSRFFKFFHFNFVSSHFGWCLLAANSAELLVIDQLGDCRIFPACRAIRILAQLELAKFHGQRVDQQQPPDQWIACAQNQLDGFRRLNHSYQSGQNSQHSAFRAGWNQSRRWRLRIQAAIAWAFFGRENTRLPFEAEDRSINIRLAGEHAGVIHQIASRKVVRAVGDDVEFFEQLDGVVARKPGVELS